MDEGIVTGGRGEANVGAMVKMKVKGAARVCPS